VPRFLEFRDLDQNPKNLRGETGVGEPLRVFDACQSGLDANARVAASANDFLGTVLGEIHRREVGCAPAADERSSLDWIDHDPRPSRDADRYAAGAADLVHNSIDHRAPQALPAVIASRVKVDRACTRSHTQAGILG
jgi:hypothetical protein